MAAGSSNQVHHLKVTIKGIKPPVWRRVLVGSTATLAELHDVIQAAFGWWGYHLHEFEIAGVRYGVADDEDWGEPPRDEHRARLNKVAPAGRRFTYTYDFGDNWIHVIEVEKVEPAVPGLSYPTLVGGRRACPPEDCGGPWRYPDLLAALADPEDEEHDEVLEWVGGSFDPEAFDPAGLVSSAAGGRNIATLSAYADGTDGFTVGAVQDGAGLAFRVQDGDNYWKLVASTSLNKWQLYKTVAGNETLVASTAAGTCCTPGQQLKISHIGSAIAVWIDGDAALQTSDAALASAAAAGPYTPGTGTARFDNVWSASLTPGVNDGYNRADSTTTLGTSGSGHTYTVLAGTWGISTNSAYLVSASGTNNMAVTNGAPDAVIKFTTPVAQNNIGAVFRVVDANNFWSLRATPSYTTWSLYKTVNGTQTFMGNTGGTTCCNSLQTVMIETAGANITVSVNSTQYLRVTDATHAEASQAGLYASATGTGRLDNFSVDALGAGVTASVYDRDGNLTKAVDANNRVTRYTYSAAGELTDTTRPDNSVLRTVYDDNGNITQQRDGADHATTYSYDPLDQIDTVTDPLGRVTRYSHDPAGQVTGIAAPGGTCTTPKSACTTLSYDAAGQLTAIDYSDSTPDVTYTYDRLGRTDLMVDGTGTTDTDYDSLGRITRVTDGQSQQVTYGYNLAGLPTTITYPANKTVTRGYDDAGNLTSITDWLANQTTFGYDPNGNLNQRTNPNGVTTTYGYTKADQVATIIHRTATAELTRFAYTRDEVGNIETVTQNGVSQLSQGYTYNALNQISNVKPANNLPAGDPFTYDAADNLTGLPVGTFQAFDTANQLCWTATAAGTNCSTPPSGATTYQYDQRGNRTSRTQAGGPTTTYTYDLANRLTAAGTNNTFTYNGHGLRTRKTVNSTTTNYTWDQAGGIPNLLVDGNDAYIYGPGGQPTARINGTAVTYLHQDHLGSTRLLTDNTVVCV